GSRRKLRPPRWSPGGPRWSRPGGRPTASGGPRVVRGPAGASAVAAVDSRGILGRGDGSKARGDDLSSLYLRRCLSSIPDEARAGAAVGLLVARRSGGGRGTPDRPHIFAGP